MKHVTKWFDQYELAVKKKFKRKVFLVTDEMSILKEAETRYGNRSAKLLAWSLFCNGCEKISQPISATTSTNKSVSLISIPVLIYEVKISFKS